MSRTITLSEQATGSRFMASFGTGLLTSTLLVLLACGVLVPRYADLLPLGDAVLKVALLLATVGIALCVPKRTRTLGAGVAVGVGLGLVLAWCALVAYIGLVQV